jgi:hypothetical protein
MRAMVRFRGAFTLVGALFLFSIKVSVLIEWQTLF